MRSLRILLASIFATLICGSPVYAAAPVPVSKGTVSEANLLTSGTTSATPSYPADVAANDIVFILVGTHGATTLNDAVYVAPAGFEIAAQATKRTSTGTVRGRVALMWQRAAGGESGTVTVETTQTCGTANNCALHTQMYRITGAVTTGDPWDDIQTTDETAGAPGSATLTWLEVTVSGTERTLLAFVSQGDETPGAGTPTGYAATIAGDFLTALVPDSQLVLFDLQDTSTDGAVTGTGGEANGWRTFHLSIAPATAAAATPTRSLLGVGQ